MKKRIKAIINTKKLQDLLSKYKLSYEYISVNRTMVTRGIFLGLFTALLPIPFQMLVVILLMRFFIFNVPIAVILCWVTNPITMPFIYYAEYMIGSTILNTEVLVIEMSVEWFSDNFASIFLQLYFGAFLLASVISSLMYFFVNYLWIYFVYQNKKVHHRKRKK